MQLNDIELTVSDEGFEKQAIDARGLVRGVGDKVKGVGKSIHGGVDRGIRGAEDFVGGFNTPLSDRHRNLGLDRGNVVRGLGGSGARHRGAQTADFVGRHPASTSAVVGTGLLGSGAAGTAYLMGGEEAPANPAVQANRTPAASPSGGAPTAHRAVGPPGGQADTGQKPGGEPAPPGDRSWYDMDGLVDVGAPTGNETFDGLLNNGLVQSGALGLGAYGIYDWLTDDDDDD